MIETLGLNSGVYYVIIPQLNCLYTIIDKEKQTIA